uniref:AC55 n=1 Tax=Bombyx mori nuclear polyhedrosis virus TaxID=271108 RepID=A0A8F5AK84_NPVBM|nr:AC55 [Bombyx mori nucleopolyhedrovirus]
MKKVALGKIIENTIESKYKSNSVSSSSSSSSSTGTSAKLSLSEYYKTFEANKVGQHTTYDVVGKRDYNKFDKLVKKY